MTVEVQRLPNRVRADLEARYQALSHEVRDCWRQVWESHPAATLAVLVGLLTVMMVITAAEANSQSLNSTATSELPGQPATTRQEPVAQLLPPLEVDLLAPLDGEELTLTGSYTVTFQVTRNGKPVNYHYVSGVSTCPQLQDHPDSFPTGAEPAPSQAQETQLIPLQTQNPDGLITVSYYTPEQVEALGYSYRSCITHPDGFCYLIFAPSHECLGEPVTLYGYAADSDGPVFSNEAQLAVIGHVLFAPHIEKSSPPGSGVGPRH